MADDRRFPFLLAPVEAWFTETFGEPTPAQALGWPVLARGESALLLAPTGSGKTLAAFLVALNDVLERKRQGGGAPRGVHTIYVSPLKALNADVHRNLEEPLAGIRARDPSLPEVTRGLRTGDTPPRERAAQVRTPPDVLITTPESLYLLLTSERARAALATAEVVIVDEIHAILGTKRGAHLALSLERLEALCGRPLQRIGLSATVRPPEEAARFLGGASRDVRVVDARGPKRVEALVEYPHGGEDPEDGRAFSAWPAVFERVRELVDAHTTTLVFANNRRQAERLSKEITALNDARPLPAHHGSVSKEARKRLEDDLKTGRLAGVVATSSLELGIDVGSIDLAVLVGSPRSVASALQRVGRAGHQVGETSRGHLLALHAADLVESAVVARAMERGEVEETRAAENALDVLAQQIVAHVASHEGPVPLGDLFALVRRASPYRRLAREDFLGVVEMLAGKYPAEAFRELRPRLAWDRAADVLKPLPGSRLLAIRNGGTIPDRGYYGVYLEGTGTRLGELDEEFVHETRAGEVFLLGSGAWRVLSIEQDRVLVADARGELPKTPFWRGDAPPRTFALGEAVGAFLRECERRLDDAEFGAWLASEHRLDAAAARALEAHLRAQREATGRLPTDRTIVVEHFHDELGDPRLVVHGPWGGAVNGPLALALQRLLEERLAVEVQALPGDDGVLLRFPDAETEPPLDLLDGIDPEDLVRRALEGLGETSLFGGLFREAAERALLLPRTTQGRRPFWIQRLRANDLLQVARRFGDFPLLAEAYRDALSTRLDVAGLRRVLDGIASGDIEVVVRTTGVPSPFAAGLLFQFLGIYMYEAGVPRTERAAGLVAVNREVLERLLGPGTTRDILRPEAIAEEAARAAGTAEGYRARTAEELLQFLARHGDLDDEEAASRADGDAAAHLASLAEQGRIVRLGLPGCRRWIPVEEAPTYRAALGRPLPRNAPRAGAEADARRLAAGLLAEGPAGALVALPVEEDPSPVGALRAILARFARVRGPFPLAEATARYGLAPHDAEGALDALVADGLLEKGRFTPGRAGDEYVDQEMLARVHRRTLGILRREAQPVEPDAFARFLLAWQRADRRHRRRGLPGVEAALEQLAGAALPGEVWERDVLPLRVDAYPPGALAELSSGGAFAWVGAGGRGRFRVVPRGEGAPWVPDEPAAEESLGPASRAVRAFLLEHGASFFHEIDAGGSEAVAEGLAELVRLGEVTNDSFEVMRHVLRSGADVIPRSPRARLARRSWMGRWSLARTRAVRGPPLSPEEGALRVARQLLARYGVASREVAASDGPPVPWAAVQSVLATLEARGEVRRGYFVNGLSGAQYALPEAVERLREARRVAEPREAVLVNACDPANPYGALLPYPALRRTSGNYVVLLDGEPVVVAETHGRRLLPQRELSAEERALVAKALARLLTVPAVVRTRRDVTVEEWAGRPILGTEMGKALEAEGFEAERGRMVLYPSHVRAE